MKLFFIIALICIIWFNTSAWLITELILTYLRNKDDKESRDENNIEE